MTVNSHAKEDNDRHFHSSLYGGQAIIEGVMMKGPERSVAAVRAPSNVIVHKILREGSDERKRNFWYKTPFLRGVLILIDTINLGYKALIFSAEIADPEAKPRNALFETLMLVVSLIFALTLFKFLPILIATWILGSSPKETSAVGAQLLNFSVAWSALEGIIKAFILVSYMLVIRLWKDVRRVFQYHGAEHKTINAYESGSDLSLDDVIKYPTFHPRCGTSFLFALILFSLVLAMLFPLITSWLFNNPLLAMNMGYRLILHLVFLPLIAAAGYEFVRYTSKLDSSTLFMRFLTYPGRLFQRITALEPEKEMVEVAIVSLHHAMGIPTDKSISLEQLRESEPPHVG